MNSIQSKTLVSCIGFDFPVVLEASHQIMGSFSAQHCMVISLEDLSNEYHIQWQNIPDSTLYSCLNTTVEDRSYTVSRAS